MSIDKLAKMVNAKNAMSLDWGDMLYEYLQVVASTETAQRLRAQGAIAMVLSDGHLSFEDVTVDLGMGDTRVVATGLENWIRLGGNAEPVQYEKDCPLKDGYHITRFAHRCDEGSGYETTKYVTNQTISKLAFINAMKRFCSDADLMKCYKDVSACKSDGPTSK